MKKYLILFIALLPLAATSQDKGTLSASTHFQSDHDFIPMKRNDVLYIMNCIEPMWHKRFHYTTGIGVNYRFPNQLELSTGIRYSRKKEEFTGYPFYFCGTVDYALLACPPLTRHYIEMPLLARYYFLPGKLKLHVETGWIGSYEVQQNQTYAQSSWLLAPQTGIGVNIFLNRWQLSLGANYRLQFELGDRSPYTVVNPHAFGIEFKTAFSLNR